MGAPVSVLEAELQRSVLTHLAWRRMPRLGGKVVIEFPAARRGLDRDARREGPTRDAGSPGSDHGEGGVARREEALGEESAREHEAGALRVMVDLAGQRGRVEARMVLAAKDVLAEIGEALLADKGFTSVEELSATGRRKWRAEAKALAVGELQVALGVGVTAARRLVGVATAPTATTSVVVGALQRGEASLDMVLRFWECCGRLGDEDGADVARALFGTDPACAAVERLDPEGNLRTRPWHAGQFEDALKREALARAGKDVTARREQRRAALAERDTTMRVHDDGTATLTVRGALTTGAAIYQRIDRCSRALRAGGDPRTLAQLRADISAALLLHGVLPLPGHDQPTPTFGPGQHHRDPGQDGAGDRAGRGPGAGQGRLELGMEDLVTPADLEQIARIVNAVPPVQLQVVIGWEALTGRPACTAPCCTTGDSAPAGAKDPHADTGPPAGDGSPRRDAPRGSSPLPPGGTGPPRTVRRRGAVGQVLGVPGGGFITPEHARVLAIAPGTTLSRLLTDPADGRLIERSIASYRPDADMRRQVRAADVTSRAPGSRVPAARCDLDHEHPFAAGGPTSEANLNCKDRRPHGFKTKGWWRTVMAPNRDVTWTTLLGQTETTRAHDYRQYLDARAPLDPEQDQTHPSQRDDHADRLDLAGQALYAALAHRDPHAALAAPDDAHGATDHDPALGGWVWVSHTNPDGIRRHGPPPDHPTPAEVLGIPTGAVSPEEKPRPGGRPLHGEAASGRQPARDQADTVPDAPWAHRDPDEPPPF